MMAEVTTVVFHLDHEFKGYLNQAGEPFDLSVKMAISFDPTHYRISISNYPVGEILRPYSEPLLHGETLALAAEILAAALSADQGLL